MLRKFARRKTLRYSFFAIPHYARAQSLEKTTPIGVAVLNIVVWLNQPHCQEVSQVGGKAANLSRLAAAYRVPPGFCLTTAAYTQWLTATKADATNPWPTQLHDTLAQAYGEMATRCALDTPVVAVRSSAIDEDSQDASFAGQYETYLNIAGTQAVAQAIGRCWQSTRSPQVLEYRRQYNLPLDNVSIAVLVQQMVPADVSAVVFSANPVSGARDEVMINASWGLGESVVGGTVTPDTYVIDKQSLQLTQRQIADKQRMTVASTEGTKEVDVPRFMRSQAALDDKKAAEMARLAIALEQDMGWPADIECAYHGDDLYLLQCRPITTLT